jgi:hypothetical protein
MGHPSSYLLDSIALGMDYRDTFQYSRPGFRLDDERARRANAGEPETFGEDDLYPDAAWHGGRA